MIRATMWLTLVCLPTLASVAQAQVVNALSCSSTDVQNALAKVTSDGAIINIPAGTCQWSTTVTYNQTYSTTILGAGSRSIVGGGDVTVIVDDIARGSDVPDLQVNTASGKSFRISGLTFQGGTGGTTYHGLLHISGTSQQVRIDHIHFNQILDTSMQVDDVYGVMDHCLFDLGAGTTHNGIHFDTPGAGGFGDEAWSAATSLGSSNFFFVENNTFNGGWADDCGDGGGRFVIRYNTLNGTPIQTHPTGGGGRLRGCRAWEVYKNTYNGSSSSPVYNAFWVSNGTGVIWGNSAPVGYENFITGHVMRANNSTYAQTAPPNGWGYCGTGQTGTASAWDENTSSTGYACIDQLGRGKGDLLVNNFPNAVDQATGTIAWPNQALEPIYEWDDTWAQVPGYPTGAFWAESDPPAVQNRDYYLYASTFNGTSGTGSGLLSARPSTCTPEVAYWATDTQTLYQCATTNTWSVYYKPYVYPHPLDVTSSATAPAAPANLVAVAY